MHFVIQPVAINCGRLADDDWVSAGTLEFAFSSLLTTARDGFLRGETDFRFSDFFVAVTGVDALTIYSNQQSVSNGPLLRTVTMLYPPTLGMSDPTIPERGGAKSCTSSSQRLSLSSSLAGITTSLFLLGPCFQLAESSDAVFLVTERLLGSALKQLSITIQLEVMVEGQGVDDHGSPLTLGFFPRFALSTVSTLSCAAAPCRFTAAASVPFFIF